MRYGFVIDHRKCIGCHACTVACKSENNVPVGAFRTWVKYIEKGAYPDTQRFFSVLRCNHCDDAPCITICPVTALYRRDDGIVDFDGDRCIGCKACMQACPYDALYINPNTNTAEKCNYCAHRVELQLEPACVVVCPVQAIVSGDLDDPDAPIARLIANEETLVRKPEAGTRPKLHYIDANPSSLVPADQTHAAGYLWAEMQSDPVFQDVQALADADAKARTTYDVAHERPWGWKVSAYLWTKSVSSGSFLLAAVAIGLGFVPGGVLFRTAAPWIALVFLALTLVLLVADLKRPERFLSIMFRPQWRSWLVIGGYILAGYGAVLAAWLAIDWFEVEVAESLILWPGAILAALSAIYSAFLFRQARGRVFWHSSATPVHLFAQAIVAGAAALVVFSVALAWWTGSEWFGTSRAFLYYELIGSVLAHGALVAAEVLIPEENVERARAARLLTRGIFSKLFWGGAILAGVVAPLLLLGLVGIGSDASMLTSAVLALAGLFIWEHLWVQAGQAIPLS